jgi:SAM-dependent methyltransferase
MSNIYDKIECKVRPGEFDEILNYHDWRHRILIRDGFVTQGYLSDYYWDLSHFPKDLTGKTVLDIGSNDGINSFHCERIGAKQVTGIDLYREEAVFRHTAGWSSRGCELAKKYLNSKVEFRSLSLFDVASLGQQYDVVLLADVMNWLGDIPSVIKAVSSVCSEKLIIRDGLMRKKEGTPFLQYVHSPTMDLMYLPNTTFMEVILKQNGFKDISIQKIAVERLWDEWVGNYPLLTSKAEIPVFLNPWSPEPLRKIQLRQHQALSKIDGRLFARAVGWVNVEDVEAEVFTPGTLARFARKVFGDRAVHWMREVLANQVDESYTITAYR